MCGIFCELSHSKSNSIIDDNEIKSRISNRGPDCVQTVIIEPVPDVTITFCGAVLWMQGAKLTPQPLENDNGILLYNGDIFDETWNNSVNDTQTIMDMLCQENEGSREAQIIHSLKSLRGPFSLIYYDKCSHNIYFARDRIGRSTMLLYKTKDTVVISSVLARKYPCIEVPATHIYRINIKSNNMKLYPWCKKFESSECNLNKWMENLYSQQSLPDEEFKFDFDYNIDLSDNDGIINLIQTICNNSNCKSTVLKNLLDNTIIRNTVQKLIELLEKSVEIRLKRQPNKCKNCLETNELDCNHSAVGVLFSGGLDCTILALLANKYLPENQTIDLINVAFKKDDGGSYDVPDRLTGRQSYEELKKLCPLRKWIFREINVPKEHLEQYQISVIADLVYPRQTILDESLGSALWFAARGKNESNVSPCRVLLLGSGADELFGGYTRHRNAYKRRGWTGLAQELLLDWTRISFRNLSRDNRVICDHGRQPRMPYLDENFTEFVLNLKPWLKCFPSENLGPGLGDKLMLRLVAYSLGLTKAVILPKRALQFGSRIANKKEKGSDISQRFNDCNKM